MKILVICHFELYRDLTASFVHNQIREYAALGHRVRVIVPVPLGKPDRAGGKIGPLVKKQTVDNVEILDVRFLSASGRGRKRFNHESAIAALKLCKKALLGDFTPDVIHAHTLGFDSRIGTWLKERYHCPLVVTTHGGDTARPLARGEGHILRADCERIDRIVAVSGPLRAQLASCGTDTPIDVIHNGFVPREMGEADRDPFGIIQVGHLIESKHFDTTIKALALLKDKYPRLHLTAIGEGKLRSRLEGLCEELGVGDRVTFTGPLPNAEVFARMCRSRFFVMPSHPEGFGIVYLEAMAAGCITLGTEGQGIADIIESGENGFLVPPDAPEAVAALLDAMLKDPDASEKIAHAGQAAARSMTWEHTSRQYLTLFETLKAR